MNLSERYHEKLDGNWNGKDVGLDGILLQLEVTNACNHKCYFCPNRDSTRIRKMLDVNFAKKVMEDCADFLGKGKKICFHMNGEPLLYGELPELVRYSKELDYEYSFVTTNGSVATDELLTELFESGLDSIKFSINAGSRENYLKIHGRDDFECAMRALKFSYEYREKYNKNFKIFVSCVGTKDNYFELEEFNALAEKYCDEVVFYYPCGYAGQNNELAKELRYDLSNLDIKTFDIKHTCPCNVLWNSINVTCEGYLSLCCSESDNRLIVEDLNKVHVKDAWLGEKMTEIRRRHLAGDIINMPCYSCVTETEYDIDSIDKNLFKLSLDKRNKGKRVKNRIEAIDYTETQDFFRKRADKFRADNPYSVTMYQDNNPALVMERNEKEIEKILPNLMLDEHSKVLDVACGIGRWSDAIKEPVYEYCGVDFSEELIEIAIKRNMHLINRSFLVGAVNEIENVLKNHKKGKYNRILLIGILMYLNEEDVNTALSQIEAVCEEHAVICIREPIGITERLTLKGVYSEELEDTYNAIYRTKDELMKFFEEAFIAKGFKLKQGEFLFSEDTLNNRKETAQYYYIFER